MKTEKQATMPIRVIDVLKLQDELRKAEQVWKEARDGNQANCSDQRRTKELYGFYMGLRKAVETLQLPIRWSEPL